MIVLAYWSISLTDSMCISTSEFRSVDIFSCIQVHQIWIFMYEYDYVALWNDVTYPSVGNGAALGE